MCLFIYCILLFEGQTLASILGAKSGGLRTQRLHHKPQGGEEGGGYKSSAPLTERGWGPPRAGGRLEGPRGRKRLHPWFL